MSHSKPPACPECEKLSSVSKESEKFGMFLSWIMGQGLVIAHWIDNPDEEFGEMPEVLVPAYQGDLGINKLLAKFFDIDLDRVERERMALLKWLRENNQGEANGKD